MGNETFYGDGLGLMSRAGPANAITWKNLSPVSRDPGTAIPARLAGMMSVCRDLGTFVKRNKNQLHDYMTAGPARLAEIPGCAPIH